MQPGTEFLLWLQTLPLALSLNQMIADLLAPILQPLAEALVGIFGGPAQTYPLDILRVLIAVPVFIYASHRDIQERIVRDHVWLPIYVFGTLFLIYDILAGDIQTLAPWVAGNILFAVVIGYVLYWTELFGGADRKALIGLAILFPTYPLLITFPLIIPPVLDAPMNAFNMFALTILANTAIIAAFYPVKTLVRNIMDGFDATRPGLMLTAQRVPLNDAPTYHGKILPTWTFQSDTALGRFVALIKSVRYGLDTQFLLDYLEWHNSGSDREMVELSDLDKLYIKKFLNSDANLRDDGEPLWHEDMDIDAAEEAILTLVEQDEVWMTPGIPFIVPMTLGLVVSLTLGDLMYWLVFFLN